jgi:hypothetical protein
MFMLVAFMSFYLGIGNIKRAVSLFKESGGKPMNILLFTVGILLIFVAIACTLQAVADRKKPKEEIREEKNESGSEKAKFFYDIQDGYGDNADRMQSKSKNASDEALNSDNADPGNKKYSEK